MLSFVYLVLIVESGSCGGLIIGVVGGLGGRGDESGGLVLPCLYCRWWEMGWRGSVVVMLMSPMVDGAWHEWLSIWSQLRPS